MSHSEFSDRLSEYLERELADREHDRFSAHLAECADCAGELRELEGTVRLLRGLPEPELPPAFARTVIARVRAEAEREGLGERVRRWLTPMRLAPLAAGAALAGFALLAGVPMPALAPSDGTSGEEAQLAASAPAEPASSAAEPTELGEVELVSPFAQFASEHPTRRALQEYHGRRPGEMARLLRGSGHPHSRAFPLDVEGSEPGLLTVSPAGFAR